MGRSPAALLAFGQLMSRAASALDDQVCRALLVSRPGDGQGVAVARLPNFMRMDTEVRSRIAGHKPAVASEHRDTECFYDPAHPEGMGVNVRGLRAPVILAGPFETEAKRQVIVYHEIAHVYVRALVRQLKHWRVAQCVMRVVRSRGGSIEPYDAWPD